MIGEDANRAELRRRLGGWGVLSGRERRALAGRLGAGEAEAVFYAAWRWRGWIGMATDRELVLARRPFVLPDGDAVFRWAELDDVRSSPLSIDLRFAGRPLSLLAVAPTSEQARLLEAARRHAGRGEPGQTVQELQDLARRKLGRFLAYGHTSTIEGLPDRLEPGERVARLATGKLDFDGLLVLTDRRLLLIVVGLRAGTDRLWEVEREAIGDAKVTPEGLRLSLRDGPVVLGDVHPERAEELAAVLARRGPMS